MNGCDSHGKINYFLFSLCTTDVNIGPNVTIARLVKIPGLLIICRSGVVPF